MSVGMWVGVFFTCQSFAIAALPFSRIARPQSNLLESFILYGCTVNYLQAFLMHVIYYNVEKFKLRKYLPQSVNKFFYNMKL